MITITPDAIAATATGADAGFSFDPASRGALLALLRRLDATGYDFVPTTPSTHARVVARADRQEARNARDVLGWSLPVAPGVLPVALEAALRNAGVLTETGDGRLKPLLRVSRVEGILFWHSPYPTDAGDSVFLGPDSYRFALFVVANIDRAATAVLDYGAGAGVGGIVAARHARDAVLTIADINPRALFLASINAERAGVRHRTELVASPSDLPDRFDLMVTHPPFMIDPKRRAYRDGGDLHGAALSLSWMLRGAELLAPGGRLIMHTGAAIVDGRDVLLDALRTRLPVVGTRLDYHELDPDIFGDELDRPVYADVERVAAIGAVLHRAA